MWLQGVLFPCNHAIWSKWAPSMERTTLVTIAVTGKTPRKPLLNSTVPLNGQFRLYFFWWSGFCSYATCTSSKMHLICRPKFCVSIVFNFTWDGCNTQEKWKTKVMQKFGGQLRCIMADVQVAYYLVFTSSSKAREKRVINRMFWHKKYFGTLAIHAKVIIEPGLFYHSGPSIVSLRRISPYRRVFHLY